MQKPKYIFSVVTLSLFGIIGGYLYLSQESTQFSLSSRTNESDLVSRLRTFSGADSKWGQSPFSSGTPVVSESKEDSSPNIPQPNTLWETKTRQINGKTVIYEFGKGQPMEVAIPKEKIKEYMTTINPETGGAPYGYVTSQTEQALKVFLDNPSLPYVIKKCYNQINWHSTRSNTLKDSERYPQKLSMEDLMYIDTKTGLKELQEENIRNIIGAFGNMNNPLTPPDQKIWKECLSQAEFVQHLLPLQEESSAVYRKYSDPEEYFN